MNKVAKSKEDRSDPTLRVRTLTHVPSNYRDRFFWRKVSHFEFTYSLAGLSVAVLCIAGGIFLFLRGISGSTTWVAVLGTSQSRLTNAAPGVVLFVVGLAILW